MLGVSTRSATRTWSLPPPAAGAEDLETICLKCLRKILKHADCENSPDLHRFRAGEAIRARPVGVMERTWQ